LSPDGDDWRLRLFGGVGVGGGITISDENWHTIPITSTVKALAAGGVGSDEKLCWLLCGGAPVLASGNFSQIFNSWVNDMSIGAGSYYEAAVNVSVDRLQYSGIGLDNMRIQLDWDWIRAHPELVPHIAPHNMPDLLTTF